MPEFMHLVSSLAPHAELNTQKFKLTPFFSAAFAYFAFVHDPHGELWTTLLKCAPIVSLMMYILLKGFAFTKDYKYSQRILLGLIFSCCGDVLLNIDLFPHGMGFFALAQICYICAFGWKPIKWLIGVPMYLAGAANVFFLYKNLDEVLRIGLPIYSALLLTMCWRSIARAMHQTNALNVFCAIGAVMFVISDGIIGLNMFLLEVPYAGLWIMLTYYTAQFGIALSTACESSSLVAAKRTTTNGSALHSHVE